MKKGVVIIVVVLLLCCCLSAVGVFVSLGYFESNGKCVFKGPLSTVTTGACAPAPLIADDTTNNNDSQDNNSDTNSDLEIYSNMDYTVEYSKDFTVDDSNTERVFFYASNDLDNLNISAQDLTISPTLVNCQDYAQQTLDELIDYDAQEENVDVTTIGGLKACEIDFSADYGTASGRVNQRQYYVADGRTTYILTITINSDDTNFAALNDAARSFTVN